MKDTLYAAVEYKSGAKPKALYHGTDREEAQRVAKEKGALFLHLGAWGWQT